MTMAEVAGAIVPVMAGTMGTGALQMAKRKEEAVAGERYMGPVTVTRR